MLTIGGVVLVTAGLSVIRSGLSPFRMLRERLAAVRDGRTARLEGDYPTEVVPLVDDLNTLLDERERRVARAMAKAGDLAHGLKTPLAVLAQDSDRAHAAGQPELAASIRQQVERMRRQIDSHLAQARATALGAATGTRASVADAARALARTMERLYADRALSITVDVPPEHLVRMPIEDLEEMLGNLLDNACKWARSRVAVSAAFDGRHVRHRRGRRRRGARARRCGSGCCSAACAPTRRRRARARAGDRRRPGGGVRRYGAALRVAGRRPSRDAALAVGSAGAGLTHSPLVVSVSNHERPSTPTRRGQATLS